MKVNIVTSMVAATLLLGTAMLYAEPGNFGVNGENAWRSVEQKRIKHVDAFGDTYYTYRAEKPKIFLEHEVHQHQQSIDASPQEVVDAFKNTLNAVTLLHEAKSKEAIETLKKVTQQLQTAQHNHPKLNQVLVSQEITIVQYLGDSKQIAASLVLAERLLKERSTQSAREIVLRLEDALIVENTYLMLNTYAANVTKALAVLEQGALFQKDERDAALLLLNMALNDVLNERVRVPIPFLKAQNFVLSAAALDASKPDEINAYLDAATEELKRAVLLGYIKADSSVYKALEREIYHIQEALKGQQKTESFYGLLKHKFEELLKETRHKIIQSDAEAKVNTYERKEDKKAFEEKKIFKNEAIEDEHKILNTRP